MEKAMRKIAIVLAALGLATMLSAAVLPAQAQAHDWGYGWRGHERYEHEWRGHRWHPGYYSYRYYGPSTYLAAPGLTFGFASVDTARSKAPPHRGGAALGCCS